MSFPRCVLGLALVATTVPGCSTHVLRADDDVDKAVVKQLPMKDPGVAAALSFVIPGSGQAYNGDLPGGYWTLFRQGLILGLMASASTWAAFIDKTAGPPVVTIGLSLFYLGSSGIAAEEAFQGAVAYNRRVVELRTAIAGYEKKAAGAQAPVAAPPAAAQ